MKRLFTNATFVTMVDDVDTADALLVDDGRIAYIGDAEEARRLADGAEEVDLGGAAVLPGLIDPHSHFTGALQYLLYADLSECTSFDEITETLKKFAAERNIGPDGVIMGNGYDQNNLVEQRHPDKSIPNAVSTDVPVLITHVSNHMGVANDCLLELAGITPTTPDPDGGHTHFDVAGTVVAALGMGLVLFGVAHLSDWGIASPQKLCPFTLCGLPPTLPAIVVGLVLLGLLVPTERRAQRRGNPLIPRAFVTSPSVRAGLSAVALPFFYMGAVGILATPYLQLVTGFTALQTGMLSLLSGIPMFLLATFLPKLAPHLSSRLIIRVGFIAIACACGLMALGVQQHGVTTALFGGMALGGFGVGAVNSQANNAVACAVTREEAEQSGGIQGAARSIGLALGTALAGTFLLLTMAGGFASQAASAGIDQSYVGPAAETASTLMSDSAFSDEARAWGADAAQVDKLVDVKASAQADAMRLSFGALGLLMAAGLLTTRHLVETAAPRAEQDKAKARRPR